MLYEKFNLKEIFWKVSHETQAKHCEIFETRSFGEERVKSFQKQGDYSHSRGHGKKQTKMGRFPCRLERDKGSVKYFDGMVC